ncbi:MAG TPA: DUF1080 domain-containing protein [Chitinophagaceae bacterium]|nr:DUF1080 domain-containing protein [Chitinophagaceae bacterium]
MHKLLFALTPVLLFACYSQKQTTNPVVHNTLSRKEQNEGWQLLFDGTSKNGWHIYNNRTDGSAWKIADGLLYLDPAAKKQGAGGGDLTTNEEYENFHLKLEWMVDSGANSGIIFLVKEDTAYRASWLTGPEMQIVDNKRHPDAKIAKHRAADLYDLIPSAPEVANGAGEWNRAEIILRNGRLEFIFNGIKVVSATLWDDAWKDMVSKSKFRTIPVFGTFPKGKIVLQDHGDRVWFRDIKIRKL